MTTARNARMAVVSALWCILSAAVAVKGFSFAAGGCDSGIPAVGASHLTAPTIYNGSLSDGSITVLLDGIPLTASTTDGPSIAVNQNHTLTLQRTNGYKGLLFRLGDVGLGALSSDDPLLKVNNYACTPAGVSGVSHTSADVKISSSAIIFVSTAASGLPLDITVVVRNTDISEFYYSPFRVNAVAIDNTPTVAPSTISVTNAPSTAQPVATAVPVVPTSTTLSPTSTPSTPAPTTAPSSASKPTRKPVTPTRKPLARPTKKPVAPTKRPRVPTRKPSRSPVAPSKRKKPTRSPQTRKPSTRKPSTRKPVKRTQRPTHDHPTKGHKAPTRRPVERTRHPIGRKPGRPSRRPPSHKRPGTIPKSKKVKEKGGKGEMGAKGAKKSKKGPKGNIFKRSGGEPGFKYLGKKSGKR